MDNVVLLKDAPNRDNALKFMDFLLEPENIAAVTNYARYAPGRDRRRRISRSGTGDPARVQPAGDGRARRLHRGL